MAENRQQSVKALSEAVAGLRDSKEAMAFLEDLCTPSELASLAERWQVARLLARGDRTYRQIHDETGVSTTTIVRVARFLNQEDFGGYRAMIERMEKENS